MLKVYSKYGQDWSYPKAADAQIIGVCSGALAAAAVCCSTSFSNLLPAAVQSVVLSFQTGMKSAEVASSVVSSRGFLDDWSLLVSRITHDEANHMIEDFAKDLVCPLTCNDVCMLTYVESPTSIETLCECCV